MSDSSTWPGAFFWLTMVSVVVLNSKYVNTLRRIIVVLKQGFSIRDKDC